METMKNLSFAMSALLLSGGAAVAATDVPKAAVDACLRHANAYTSAAPGTAQFNGDAEAGVPWFGEGSGDNWRLRVDVPGGIALTCTVSQDGRRVAIQSVKS